MARGGKREGAGRPEKLASGQRLSVGSEYCNRWNKLALEQAEKRLDSRHSVNETEADLQIIQRVPVGPMLTQVCALAEADISDWPEDLPECVSEAAEALKNRKNNLNKAGRLEPTRRPYAARKRIEHEVAEWASAEFGKRISAAYVRDCIEEYRAFKALLKQRFL